MFGVGSARLRHVGIVGVVVVLALGIVAAGAFAKPHTAVGPAQLGADSSPQSGLAVSSLSSPPADAGAGDSFAVRGAVVNSGGSELSGDVTVRLLMRGQKPRTVGTVGVRVGAGSTTPYETTVTLPAKLPDGSYALAACTPNGGEGLLSCASARRSVDVGAPGDGARTAAVRLAGTAAAADPDVCSSGAHTLSKFGDHVYPEMGNGGYKSVHTDVNLIYDAVENEFLPGTNVVLAQATQCLNDFSLDFERKGPDNEEGPGPEMQVEGVTVNGVPATFEFVQPTYPGDPNGQDDPNPAAHEAGLEREVSKTNPLPPACAPNSSKAGTEEGEAARRRCPANKMVITPARPIANGEAFGVEVKYSGTPGVHTDGDGSAEGWFLSDEPAGDGSFVTTEPVGTEAWMPLNNHPSAKPTYDFDETVTLVARRSPTANSSASPATRPTRTSRAARPPGAGTRPSRSPATWSRAASAATTCERAARRRRRPLLRGAGGALPANRRATTKRSWTRRNRSSNSRNGSPGPSRSRPTASSSAPRSQLRGGDAGEDHLRRRGDRPKHLQPREHAPVVRRQRLGVELQHDLLQGGPGAARPNTCSTAKEAAIAAGGLDTSAGEAAFERA